MEIKNELFEEGIKRCDKISEILKEMSLLPDEILFDVINSKQFEGIFENLTIFKLKIDRLKEDLEKNQPRYHFFFGGIFSNWYPSNFTIDGIEFNCGEQYMMYQKAILFNDEETAAIILKEKNPRSQQALGKLVKNFDKEQWDKLSFSLIKKGLREKFNQNENLKIYLLGFKGYFLVEASPIDKIWGIGFDKEHAMENMGSWGENRLGKILTELAHELE